MRTLVCAGAMVLALMSDAEAASDPCAPVDINFDVCSFASQVGKSLAHEIPRTTTVDGLVISAVSFDGPTLTFQINWTKSRPELDQLLKAKHKTIADFAALGPLFACRNSAMAQFLIHGGTVNFEVRMQNGTALSRTMIKKC